MDDEAMVNAVSSLWGEITEQQMLMVDVVVGNVCCCCRCAGSTPSVNKQAALFTNAVRNAVTQSKQQIHIHIRAVCYTNNNSNNVRALLQKWCTCHLPHGSPLAK